MENLIFGAFATLDGYREGDAANLGRTVYDRCTVVALCSAKAQNPACTVALLTNAPVPEPFRSQLTQGGVEIWDCPFTTYRVPADTNWALAYYKLCAMAWVLENRDFARAAMLDLDTFTQRPLDDLWRECDEAVLLFERHGMPLAPRMVALLGDDPARADLENLARNAFAGAGASGGAGADADAVSVVPYRSCHGHSRASRSSRGL